MHRITTPPTLPGDYLVFGTTKTRFFFWVDIWEDGGFRGMGKRKITYWDVINEHKFKHLPSYIPDQNGRYLVSGLKNGKPGKWVASFKNGEFNLYYKQEVLAFQELPVI